MERIKVYPSVRPGMKMVYDGDLLEVTKATYEAENGVVKLHVTLDNNMMTEVEHFSNCPVGEPIEVYQNSKSRINFRTKNIYSVVEDFEDGDFLASKLLWYGGIALGEVSWLPAPKRVEYGSDVFLDADGKLIGMYCIDKPQHLTGPVVMVEQKSNKLIPLALATVETSEEKIPFAEVVAVPQGVDAVYTFVDVANNEIIIELQDEKGNTAHKTVDLSSGFLNNPELKSF